MTDLVIDVEDVRPVLSLATASGINVRGVIDTLKAIVIEAIENRVFGRPPSLPSMLSAVGARLAEPPARNTSAETPSRVAAKLGVSAPTVCNWIRNGILMPNGERVKLHAVRVGNRHRIDRQALGEFLVKTDAAHKRPEVNPPAEPPTAA